ncbi:methylated-DNA--[protein]-cysteine S-methyltransferase [Calditrichota bacterium]
MAGYNPSNMKIDRTLFRKRKFETPFGELHIVGLPDNYLEIYFPNEIDELDTNIRDLSGEQYPLLKKAEQFLKDYFSGKRILWDGGYLPTRSAFMDRAWAATASIPFGTVITYAELANRAGSPKASRAAGMAMANNPLPILIPCHRVLGSNGSLTGFGGGLDVKRWLLEHEGVSLD